MRIRRLAVLAAAIPVGAAVVLAGPAASAAPIYPPAAPAITLSANVADPGQQITVTGTGFKALSAVDTTWTGPGARGMVGLLPFGARSLTADSSGVASTAITFSTVGSHTITMTGVDALDVPLTLSATLDVRAAGAAADLPHTGFPVLEVVALGAMLLLLGSLVVATVRRRRAAPAVAAAAVAPQRADLSA